MAETTLLLGPNDISKFTSTGGNVDIDLLAPHIYSAQITKIKQILGIPLYNKILVEYSADTLTGEYKIIYDEFVLDMLVYLANANYLLQAPYQVANGGVFKHTTADAAPADIEEVRMLVTNYKDLSAAIELMFLDYMKTIDIPEWPKACGSGSSFNFPWTII